MNLTISGIFIISLGSHLLIRRNGAVGRTFFDIFQSGIHAVCLLYNNWLQPTKSKFMSWSRQSFWTSDSVNPTYPASFFGFIIVYSRKSIGNLHFPDSDIFPLKHTPSKHLCSAADCLEHNLFLICLSYSTDCKIAIHFCRNKKSSALRRTIIQPTVKNGV